MLVWLEYRGEGYGSVDSISLAISQDGDVLERIVVGLRHVCCVELC
jgi:hypothetical protein